MKNFSRKNRVLQRYRVLVGGVPSARRVILCRVLAVKFGPRVLRTVDPVVLTNFSVHSCVRAHWKGNRLAHRSNYTNIAFIHGNILLIGLEA